MGQVSIKDIAKAAGVSFSTVSRALNGNPLISQEVRARVQTLAREMGYTPNALAQGLQSRMSHTVGLVITTISDPFFVDVVKGVEEVAREANFSLVLATSNNDPDQEMKIIETFSRRRVDGVIVAASQITSDYAARLEGIRIPVVMVNEQAMGGAGQQLFSVTVDDFAGGRLAVEHLIGLGHRSIGYIGAGNRPRSNSRRYRSYQAVLAEHGILPAPEWSCLSKETAIGDLEGDIRIGQCIVPQLLEAGVTAVFCYCDTVAVGAMLACHDLGVRVPEQVSLIGYDDNLLSEVTRPRLTTIHQPKREMGQAAMRMLLACMSGSQIGDLTLQPSLLVRGSTAPPHDTA